MAQLLENDRVNEVAEHLLDRLIQELTLELLPILRKKVKFSVEIDHSEERSAARPIKFSVTKHIN